MHEQRYVLFTYVYLCVYSSKTPKDIFDFAKDLSKTHQNLYLMLRIIFQALANVIDCFAYGFTLSGPQRK